VSLDDVQSVAKFAQDQKLSFSLLSDPDGGVARKYGVLGDGAFARRVTFVLDPEGVVRHVDEKVNVTTHGADLAAVIEKLQGE